MPIRHSLGLSQAVQNFFNTYYLGKQLKRQDEELAVRKEEEARRTKQDQAADLLKQFQGTGTFPLDLQNYGDIRRSQIEQGIKSKLAGAKGDTFPYDPEEANRQLKAESAGRVENYIKSLGLKMAKVGRSGGTDPTALNNAQLNAAIKSMEDDKFNNPHAWDPTHPDYDPNNPETLQLYLNIRKQRGLKAGGSFTPQPKQEPLPKQPGVMEQGFNYTKGLAGRAAELLRKKKIPSNEDPAGLFP